MRVRPIRVMFVVPNLFYGGAERNLTTLLPRMDPARFTPSLICIGEEGYAGDSGLFPTLPAAGIEAAALRLHKRQAVRALIELVMMMRRTRPDVVVVQGYNAETLGRIAARIAGVKHTINWVHNIGAVEPRGTVRRTVDRALTRWTSGYFGVAETQRPYLVDELGYPDDKIRIIHNGVDPAQFSTSTDRGVRAEFGFAEDDPVVGIVARFRPEKDHVSLLRAARAVVDELPHARFLLIGDGAIRPQLEALCTELQITPNVHFAGSRHDVPRLLQAIDVFVLSSVTVECFPIALLEAMACARPAVCTAVGGIPEMVNDGETGYLVPPKDPQQLAARLVRLLRDPQTARRMGRAARARIEAEFTLDRSIAATQQAIEDVVSGQAVLSGRV
jgi:glycosyltransferase involved in cell wall biosynthesis